MNTLQQQLPERFTRAVTKLYNAFHKGELDAFECKACAVGNILGHNKWIGISVSHDRNNGCKVSLYPGTIRYFRLGAINNSGYNQRELAMVEYRFLHPWRGKFNSGKDKELQFKGLCAVVQYLCELDNIPNIMDYTSLFEYDKKDNPVKELIL